VLSSKDSPISWRKKTAAEAVAHIRESRKGMLAIDTDARLRILGYAPVVFRG